MRFIYYAYEFMNIHEFYLLFLLTHDCNKCGRRTQCNESKPDKAHSALQRHVGRVTVVDGRDDVTTPQARQIGHASRPNASNAHWTSASKGKPKPRMRPAQGHLTERKIYSKIYLKSIRLALLINSIAKTIEYP